MIKLSELSLLDIMPENLARDKEVQNAAKALDVSMHDISEQIKYVLLISRIDELEEDIVDQLAWQFHVDAYDSSFDIGTKRKLVKQSIGWHKLKGTPYAVQSVVSAILDGAHVQEWFEYGGEPYHFKVALIEGPMTSSQTIRQLVRAINEAKNARSWLDGVEFSRTVDTKFFFTAATYVNKTVMIGLPKFTAPNIFDALFLNTAQHIHKEVNING